MLPTSQEMENGYTAPCSAINQSQEGSVNRLLSSHVLEGREYTDWVFQGATLWAPPLVQLC